MEINASGMAAAADAGAARCAQRTTDAGVPSGRPAAGDAFERTRDVLPADALQSFAVGAGTGVSTGLSSAGKKLLVDAPALSIQWESTTSAWTGKGGFSHGLNELLEGHGIVRPFSVNPAPPESRTKGSGVPLARANNENGKLAQNAIADTYRGAGRDVHMEVARDHGTRRVDIRIDVKASDPRKSERIEIESKVGRTTLSPTVAAQAAKDGQALAENRAVRRAGRALETAGKIALPLAVAGDAIELGRAYRADGNTIGVQTGKTAAGIAGGWALAIGGAEAGATLCSVVPFGGTIVGGLIGGVVGGIAGTSLGRNAFDEIASLF